MGGHDPLLALIAMGSNRCHGRHGRPEGVLRAAVAALEEKGLAVQQVSRLHATAPVGPGGRRFANAALRAHWAGDAATLLALLQQVERDFGRRRARRWGDRVLDLDLLALGRQVVRAPGLRVPHPGLAKRRFVLDPLVEVAPCWRHPQRNATVRQLRARAMRPKRR
jgi:2-amino-4-hydroxy-6-hydroxymethyldihydropteridine diphosphokinase